MKKLRTILSETYPEHSKRKLNGKRVRPSASDKFLDKKFGADTWSDDERYDYAGEIKKKKKNVNESRVPSHRFSITKPMLNLQPGDYRVVKKVVNKHHSGPWGVFSDTHVKHGKTGQISRIPTGNAQLMGLLPRNEETQIDEISRATLGSYAKKSAEDATKKEIAWKKPFGPFKKNLLHKLLNRQAGHDKAVDRLANEETQIDELKKSTLLSYVRNASKDLMTKSLAKGQQTNGRPRLDNGKLIRKMFNRQDGINAAARALAVPMPEETKVNETFLDSVRSTVAKLRAKKYDNKVAKAKANDDFLEPPFHKEETQMGESKLSKAEKEYRNDFDHDEAEMWKAREKPPFTPDKKKSTPWTNPHAKAKQLARSEMKRLKTLKEILEPITELHGKGSLEKIQKYHEKAFNADLKKSDRVDKAADRDPKTGKLKSRADERTITAKGQDYWARGGNHLKLSTRADALRRKRDGKPNLYSEDTQQKLGLGQRLARKTTNFLKKRDSDIVARIKRGHNDDQIAADTKTNKAIISATRGSMAK